MVTQETFHGFDHLSIILMHIFNVCILYFFSIPSYVLFVDLFLDIYPSNCHTAVRFANLFPLGMSLQKYLQYIYTLAIKCHNNLMWCPK